MVVGGGDEAGDVSRGVVGGGDVSRGVVGVET